MAENRLQHFLMHHLWLVILAVIIIVIAYYYLSWDAYQNDTQPYAEISCGRPPVYNINTEVTFSAEKSYDVDNHPLTYIYEFSDGVVLTSDKPTVTRTFSKVDFYTLTLTVRDPPGKTDTRSCDFVISEEGNPFIT